MVDAVEYDNQRSKIAGMKKFCRHYFREVTENSIRAALLLIGTAVINLMVLYFYTILWHIFSITYSGQKFILSHPEATGVISNMLKNDLVEISIHTTLTAFTICLIISALCQLTHIARHLYYPQGITTKLLFWGVPLALVVSIYINDQIQLAHWSYTLPVTLVPTLCVFTYCFTFAEALLPELGDVMVTVFRRLKEYLSRTFPQER